VEGVVGQTSYESELKQGRGAVKFHGMSPMPAGGGVGSTSLHGMLSRSKSVVYVFPVVRYLLCPAE